MSDFKITKPIFLIGLASFFTDVASESIYPLLPLFLTSVIGASPAFIGLVEGVAESTASLAKYFFGWLSDKTKKRTPFVIAGYTLANAVRPLIGLATAPWHVLLIRFSDRIGKGMRTAPRDAWLASLAPAEKRATVYGFHRAMDHAGAVLGPMIATAFLWLYPGDYRALFLWAFIPGVFGVAAVFLARVYQHKETEAVLTSDGHCPGAVPLVFKMYLVVLLIFTLGNSSDAFLLLKLKVSGVDEKFILLLWSLLHVVKSVSSIYGGRLADRIGKKNSILMGWGLYAVVYFSLGYSTSPSAVVGLFLLYGLYFGLTEGVEKALAANLVPPSLHGTAFGLYHFAIGLAALPASLIFGFLWNEFGMACAFYTGAGLAAAALLLLSALRIEPRSATTAKS